MITQAQFETYHSENPIVYRLVKKFAHEAWKAGFRQYGMKAIFERIRWHINIETKDIDGFKLNNNYHSFYARKLIKDYPKYQGFFQLRRHGQ